MASPSIAWNTSICLSEPSIRLRATSWLPCIPSLSSEVTSPKKPWTRFALFSWSAVLRSITSLYASRLSARARLVRSWLLIASSTAFVWLSIALVSARLASAWLSCQPALPVLGLHPLARFGVHPVVGTESGCVLRRVRITGWQKRFEPEVSPYPVLEFGRYGLFVAEVRSVFDRLRLRGDLDQAPPVINPDDLGRHKGGVSPEETHLYADVSHRVPLVEEDIVHPADPLVVGVVDTVLFAAAL